ncbi:MAG: glycyl-tRNA synthetase beta chain, partial [Gammaproteobacteria bacterium]
AFFDSVKVMVDEEPIKRNRLALLNNVGTLFLQTADISELQS